MIVPLAGGSVGIYPGGQSETSASPWYESFVVDSVRGRYLPLPPERHRRAARAQGTLGSRGGGRMRQSTGRADREGADPGALGRMPGAASSRIGVGGLVLGRTKVWSTGLLGWWWTAAVVGLLTEAALRAGWSSWLVGVGPGLLGAVGTWAGRAVAGLALQGSRTGST